MADALERPATISLSDVAGFTDQALEGLHVPAESSEAAGAVIAPPHPLYGGNLDSPVVSQINWACHEQGIASVRFNWRGIGASAGEVTGDPGAGAEDYGAALDWLEETVSGPITACGYSFGAATAVRAAAGRPRIHRLLLVAPPPAMLEPGALEAFEGDVLVAVGDRDEFAAWEPLQQLVEALPRGRFELLEGHDHFFASSLESVGQACARLLSGPGSGLAG